MESLKVAMNFLGLLLLAVGLVLLLRIWGDGGGWRAVEFWKGITTRPDAGKGEAHVPESE